MRVNPFFLLAIAFLCCQQSIAQSDFASCKNIVHKDYLNYELSMFPVTPTNNWSNANGYPAGYDQSFQYSLAISGY